VQTARSYLLQGPSYTAFKSPLAVMQNFFWFLFFQCFYMFLSCCNMFLKCSLHLYHANQFVVMMTMMMLWQRGSIASKFK